VAGEESEDAVSVKLADAYQAEAKSYDDEDLDRMFASSAFGLRIGEADPQWRPYAKAFRRAVKKLTDLFKKQKLVAFHLLDMTLEVHVYRELHLRLSLHLPGSRLQFYAAA
jgi:hypothetical protein